MANYSFESLSPYDFETLCRDVLQRAMGVRLQGFKTGRDTGIDLRYAMSADRTLVVQCKHYARSSLSVLMSHLRSTELPKVRRLAPERYVFATSLGLTPANHEAIAALFSPFCKSTQDVYGREDLNNLLSLHPDIEQAHFKLWLTSTPVLQRVLHNASYVQSGFDREDIEMRIRVYVRVPSVDLAQKILEETHACIISGIPGIGKTTLAHMLLIQYLVNDWEIVTVRQNISEALDRYEEDHSRKQVFWYDDFLGQVSLGDKLAKNEDRALIQLIRAISKHPNRRFILTTREYILRQAQDRYELLSRANLELHKHMLTLGDYSPVHRAKILANHLYFNGVPDGHIRALLAGRKYREIVNHRNYSPRIIEWLTDVTRTSACTPVEYFTVFMDTLKNPVRLWEHAFQNQLSVEARQLLITLASCGQMVMIDDLRHAYETLCNLRAGKYGVSWTTSDFGKAIRELEGTFLSVRRYRSMTGVCFNNPSVMDYMVHHLGENLAELLDAVNAGLFFEQIEQFVLLLQNRMSAGLDAVCPGEAATVLENALKRTLDVPGCHVIQIRTAREIVDLVREDTTRAERLLKCLDLAHLIDGLREYVLVQIDAFAMDVESYRPDRGQLVGVLTKARETKWIPKKRIDSWRDGMMGYLLRTPESWSETEALVSWREEWPEELSTEEREKMEAGLAEAVESEVSYYLADESDADQIDQFTSDLEVIVNSLGWDFSDDVRALEDRASELREPEQEYDGEEWHGGGPSGGGSGEDIDSIFDSLIH